MGLYNQALNENIDNLQVNNNVGKGGGSWAELQGKPFETIGDGLTVFNNQLVAHGYHDYSEDEQIVGTWLGKTLYEKTLTLENVADGELSTEYTLENAVSIKAVDGYAINVTNNLCFKNNTIWVDNAQRFLTLFSGNKFYINKIGLGDNSTVILTIKYTKE